MRSLLFFTGVAIAASLVYAVFLGNRSSEFRVEADGDEVRQTIRGDASEFTMRRGDTRVKAEWRGGFKLAKDANTIAFVDDRVFIEVEEDGIKQSVELAKDGRTLKRRYLRDGEEQEPGDETDAQIDAVILTFLRASAANAKKRVALLNDAGGTDTAIAELDALSGDHALRRYIEAISKLPDLSTDQINQLADQALRIDSARDRAAVIEALFQLPDINADAKSKLLTTAKDMDSDYDKRRLVAALATHLKSDEAIALNIELIGSIDGDYDLRAASEALLEGGSLNDTHVARLITLAADNLGGGHDLRRLLEATTDRLASPEVADAWIAALEELDSSYDTRNAIEAAATANPDNEALRQRLRIVAGSIESNFDREKALAAVQ